MKNCPKCGAETEDNAAFCPSCGFSFNAVPDPFDHSEEFAPEDVSENRLYALLGYLTGLIGVVVALLMHPESPYMKFHIRQILRLTVAQVLVGLVSAVLCWTILVPIAGGICEIILVVVQVICIFRVCKGRSVEPPIVRAVPFLK